MKTPIVYLHGFNSTPKIFNHIHSKLPDHEAVFITYDSFQRLEDSYEFILGHLNKLDYPKISLIGHSLGGVLALILTSRDNQIKVDKLVTLSAPFGGSSAATAASYIFPKQKILRDLSPSSPVMQEIEDVSFKNHLAFISTSGSLPIMMNPNDGVVTVRSQKAVTPKHQVEVDVNHFEVVQDVRVVSGISNFLF